MDAKSMGARIAALRRQRGWTQKELAARLHVTDKAVSKWETGVNCPDLSLWQPLAALFELPLLELLGLKDTAAETVAREMAEASAREREAVRRSLCRRAWMDLALCAVLFGALAGSSCLFYRQQLYGLPQQLTIGMTGVVGLLAGNALYTLLHCARPRHRGAGPDRRGTKRTLPSEPEE